METSASSSSGKTRALVVGPYPTRPPKDMSVRDPKARLAEAVGLALAIDLDIRGEILVNLNEVRPATYIGKGKVEEIAQTVKAEEIDLVMWTARCRRCSSAISKRPGTARSSTAPA